MANGSIKLSPGDKIAIDIDDVLSISALDLVNFSNKTWGTSLSEDDYLEHWQEMWAVDHDTYCARAEMIHQSDLINNHQHREESKPILNRLAVKYSLVVITSRRNEIEKSTYDWLERYFPGIFSEIYFTGFWNNRSLINKDKLTKAQIIKSIDAKILIDDQPKHCDSVAEIGLPAILFGDYGWNRNHQTIKGVHRAKDWSDVGLLLNHD